MEDIEDDDAEASSTDVHPGVQDVYVSNATSPTIVKSPEEDTYVTGSKRQRRPRLHGGY